MIYFRTHTLFVLSIFFHIRSTHSLPHRHQPQRLFSPALAYNMKCDIYLLINRFFLSFLLFLVWFLIESKSAWCGKKGK